MQCRDDIEMRAFARSEAKAMGLLTYSNGRNCAHGHSSNRYVSSGACIECVLLRTKKQTEIGYFKERYEENKDEILKGQIEAYKANPTSRIKSACQWNKDNQKRRREIVKGYKLRKRQSSMAYVLATRVAAGVRIALHKAKCPKKSKTVEILGCSFEEFRTHMERQFTKGMSWDLISKIHIDHIIPISSAKTGEDVVRLFHFSNLRPLWAVDNMKKGARIITLC